MRDYTWLDMMKIMQEIRLFSTLHVRRAKKEGITSAQEIDLLSRIVLSDHALTPQDLTVQMGLYKSAVSRLIDHLEKKGFLKKHYCETDKRSYVLLITETGNMELDCTYRYYLEPIYKLREVLGAESFESLTTQIQTANELLQDKKTDPKEKRKHIAIYLFKILLTVSFCVAFVTIYTKLFGANNSIVGVVVLLSVMVFRYADMGIHNPHGAFSILIIFCILAVGPRLTNMVSPGIAFFVNIICIFALMLLGCHNVIMSNHSTFVLAYLLLQGYDVSGHDYTLRLIGLLVGAASTALILYRNHKKMSYKRSFRHLFQEFDLSSARTRWQIRLTLGVSSAMLIASLLGIPRVMWIGIAAMSVLLPFRKDMEYRVKFRAPGNILGAICFLVLYTVLPESCYSYIGMIGGIGVGLSATYGWQTVFNSFGALAIATPIFGLPMAIFLRIFNNAFGSLYALAFDSVITKVRTLFEEKESRISA